MRAGSLFSTPAHSFVKRPGWREFQTVSAGLRRECPPALPAVVRASWLPWGSSLLAGLAGVSGVHPSVTVTVTGIVAGHGSVHTGGMAGYCAVGLMVPRTPNRYARATKALYSASGMTC